MPKPANRSPKAIRPNALPIATTKKNARLGPRLEPSTSERRMALTMASRERDELARNWELALTMEIRPAIDCVRLDRAFRHVVALHPRLRATYEIRKGDVTVRLLPVDAFALDEQDTSSLSQQRFMEILQEAADRPWTPATGPLVTLTVFRRPRDRMVVLLRMCHLVVDGWSIELLLRDMIMFYLGVPGVAAKAVDFDQFVQWEKRFEASHEGRAQREFWRRKLARLGPRLKLPYDRPPVSPLIRKSANSSFKISKSDMARLRTLSRRTGASVYGFMLAAYQILLHSLSGETDITALITTTRRSNPAFAEMVGLVANMVALRGSLNPRSTFQNHVSRANETVIEAMSHQECDISLVSRDLAEGALDTSSAFAGADSAFDQVGLYMMTANQAGALDAALKLRYAPNTKQRVGPFELRGLPIERSDCTRELTLFFNEIGGELLAFFSYNADLFDPATIEEFVAKFLRIVDLGLDDPGRSIESILQAL